MYRFDIHVHPAPATRNASESIVLEGVEYPTLVYSAVHQRPFVAFEEALGALERLPRMFVEPDGSFVWVGEANGERWQVDGNLFDGGYSLAYVALKGNCPPEAFDRLLGCFGWPATEVVVQLARAGVFVDEGSFRSLAARPLQ
jgi:hypothetical protein